MKKSASELGRIIITSPKLMSLLPWVSIGIILAGLVGLILGITLIVHPAVRTCGIAVAILGCGEIICGIVLFFTMCIVEDLLGLI